jgi:hypothetical protein
VSDEWDCKRKAVVAQEDIDIMEVRVKAKRTRVNRALPTSLQCAK